MEKITHKDKQNLTLLLLYLNSWDENAQRKFGDHPAIRAWKDYDFDDLDSLVEAGFIDSNKKSKSVYFSEEGVERAKVLAREILGKEI